jgi:hypothetical protein
MISMRKQAGKTSSNRRSGTRFSMKLVMIMELEQ